MKELEHEADLLAAQLRQRVFVEPRDVDAVDHDRARRRRVEPGDQPEQRRLAAARRPDDRDELAARNRQSSADEGWSAARCRSSTVFETSRSSIIEVLQHRLEHRPDVVGDDAARLRRSDGCRRAGSARSMPATPVEQERDERDAVLLGQIRIHLVKGDGVVAAEVRRRFHAGEHDRDLLRLRALDDLRQVAAAARPRADRAGASLPPSATIRILTSPSSAQSSRLEPAGRRVARDARIHDLVVRPAGYQTLLQQRRIRLAGRRPRPAVRLSPRTRRCGPA